MVWRFFLILFYLSRINTFDTKDYFELQLILSVTNCGDIVKKSKHKILVNLLQLGNHTSKTPIIYHLQFKLYIRRIFCFVIDCV